jgi:DNA polymerase elongation subunit (family B)
MPSTFSTRYEKLKDRTASLSTLTPKELEELLAEANAAMQEYDNLQQVIKINCNSLYGSFANKYFDLFDFDIAEDITTIGKHTAKVADEAINMFFATWADDPSILSKIQKTYPNISSLKNLNYTPNTENDLCVYGDTDSRYVDLAMIYDLLGIPLPESNKELTNFATFLNDQFLQDAITKRINDDLISRGAATGYMRMNHEVTARKSVFIKKKHYIMLQVWLDGKSLNPPKLKYMGISLKRGETSPELKRIIEKLIYRYLNNELDIENLTTECKKLRRFIIAKNQKNIICRSTAVSGVNDLKFENGVWSLAKNHIQAQLIQNWANFIEENNLTDTYQRAFEKQKMYFYKTVNSKYKVIGVPDDVDIDSVPNLPLPDWDQMINEQFIKPLLKCIMPSKGDVDTDDCNDFMSAVSFSRIGNF